MNNKFNLSIGELHISETGLDIKDSNITIESDCTPEEKTKQLDSLNRMAPEIKSLAASVAGAIGNRNNRSVDNLAQTIAQLSQVSQNNSQQIQMLGNMMTDVVTKTNEEIVSLKKEIEVLRNSAPDAVVGNGNNIDGIDKSLLDAVVSAITAHQKGTVPIPKKTSTK